MGRQCCLDDVVDDCVDLNYYKEAEATKADRFVKTADYEGL